MVSRSRNKEFLAVKSTASSKTINPSVFCTVANKCHPVYTVWVPTTYLHINSRDRLLLRDPMPFIIIFCAHENFDPTTNDNRASQPLSD